MFSTILDILVLFALIAAVLFAVRQGIRFYQDVREQEAREQEEHREHIALSRRMWQTIRQGEEWGVDVSGLRQARNTFDFTRKASAFLTHKRTRASLPILFSLVPMVPFELLPLRIVVGWIGEVLLAVMFLLWIWSGILFFRYFRLKRTRVRYIMEQEAALPTAHATTLCTHPRSASLLAAGNVAKRDRPS